MPRQVYGKKSRAIYDPSSIFGAQRSSPSDAREIRIPEVAEEVAALKATRRKKDDRDRSRRVLKEKEANVVSAEDGAKRRRRLRTKVVIDEQDDEDEDKVGRCTGTAIHRPIEGRGSENNHAVVCDGDPQEVDISIDIPSIRSDDSPIKSARILPVPRLPITPDSSPPKQSTIVVSTFSAIAQPETSTREQYTLHCAPLLSHSNHPLVDFSTWTSQLTPHFNLSKIAEASFGEVYRLSLRTPLPEFEKGEESVFKVIALAPPATVTRDEEAEGENMGEGWMSSIDDVTNEVRLLQRMSSIPGFTNFRDVRIVQGRPPAPFVEAFRDFDTAQRANGKGGSHFPDPGLEASHPHDQLWAVLEMQDAGTDLEKLVESRSCRDIWSVWDIFWQVVLSLAKGEEAAEFEHRDLHLGNICVRGGSSCNAAAEIDLQRTLGFTSLETTIIDYTISRAAMQNGSTAYQDLARDDGLFEGDSEEEYQYDIYRYMRGAVLYDDAYATPPFPPPTAVGLTWEGFHPISNLVWLHFVLYKLLEQIAWPSAAKAPARKRKLEYARWKRSSELESVLLRVQELLDPGVLCEEEGLKSATDLIGLALDEGWLGVEDVVGEQMVRVEEVDDVVERLGELEIGGRATREEQEEVQIVPAQATPRRKARARQ